MRKCSKTERVGVKISSCFTGTHNKKVRMAKAVLVCACVWGGGGEEENDFCELLFSLAQSSAKYFPVFPDILLITLRPAKLCFFRLVRLFWFFFFLGGGGGLQYFPLRPPPSPHAIKCSVPYYTEMKATRTYCTPGWQPLCRLYRDCSHFWWRSNRSP